MGSDPVRACMCFSTPSAGSEEKKERKQEKGEQMILNARALCDHK